MIVGLTGYHSSGKSALSEFLAKEFGWQWVIKRILLKEMSGLGDNEPSWTAWYRDLYKRMGSYEIMHHLLKQMKYTKNSGVVILVDAIHTPEEWRAIKEVDSDSLLSGVFIPKDTRLERSSPEDLVLDGNRERYWHSADGQTCLLAQVEWAFCGTANSELRTLEAKGLLDHLVRSGKIH